MFNKTEIAKYAVNIVVAATVTDACCTLISANTELEKDAKIVELPSAVVGYVVAAKLRTRTDAMVDKTAAKIKNFRNRKDTTK